MSERSVELAGTEPPQGVTSHVRYVVAKPFNYVERRLQLGEEFTPTGGRWDAQLIAGLGGFVVVEDARVSTRASRQRVRKETA